MEAALAALIIMTAPDMPKKVYREETIEHLTDLVRYQTSHNVFVAYDAMYYQLYRGKEVRSHDSGQFDVLTSTSYAANDLHASSNSPTLLVCSSDEEEVVAGKKKKKKSAGNTSRTTLLRAPKLIQILITKLATLYTKISALAEIVRIQDSTILTLCNTAMNTLSVDDIQHLQIGAVELISTVRVYLFKGSRFGRTHLRPHFRELGTCQGA
eukprot:1196144-Prorocentrum_minimum.AAC.5